MGRSLNKVELIGNIVEAPELKTTPNGFTVCTFTVATDRTYKKDGQEIEETEFHRIVAWDKLAELCGQLLSKGTRVFVEGRLQTHKYTDKNSINRESKEVVIDEMIMLSSKREE